MKQKVSIIGIQTVPLKTAPEKNLTNAIGLIDEALSGYDHADMVVLPEYFYDMDLEDKAHYGPYPEEIIEAMRARAITYNTYIIAGSVLHRREDGKLYNTALLFDRKGEILGCYDKIHLFDVLDGLGDDRESNYCERGSEIFTCQTDFGKIGISICYDIRFPEIARIMALEGVTYHFVPAAFYSPRIDHWQTLLQATALQNSMYVLGVNLFGAWDENNVFCGRSLLADPWGIVKAQASDKADYIQAYVDPDYPKQIREQIGTLHNRAPLIYEIGRTGRNPRMVDKQSWQDEGDAV
jgi:predicted amidohydrolase